jgi:hypothetical protein
MCIVILCCVLHKSEKLLVLNNHASRGHNESASFIKPTFYFLVLKSLKINFLIEFFNEFKNKKENFGFMNDGDSL